MSFFLTQAAFVTRHKTVTRRNGWKNARPGDIIMGVVKGQGIPKGEKIQKLHAIRILAVTRERLNTICPADVEKEGFPDFTSRQFVDTYCEHNGGEASQIVTRIEFEHLP